MKWDAWGDPAAAKPLSDGITALLQQALGVSGDQIPAVAQADVRLRPPTLSPADRTALTAIVGAAHYADDDRSRLLRAGGKSTLNLLQRKDFEPQDAPDAVLAPGSDDEVAEVLGYCSEHLIAVVPFGPTTAPPPPQATRSAPTRANRHCNTALETSIASSQPAPAASRWRWIAGF